MAGEVPFWVRAFGGNKGDFSFSALFSSGNLIFSGYSNSLGSGTDDVLILKIKPDGSLMWGNVAGGASSDQVFSTVETPEGSLLAVGATNSFGAGNYDLLILKTDQEGNLGPGFSGTWAKTIGGSNYDQGYSIYPSSDGGYFISGFTNSFGAGGYDLLAMKLSREGDLDWIKTIGGPSNDSGFSSFQLPEGSFVVVGSTNSFGSSGSDLLVIKVEADGSISWAKRAGGNLNDEARSVTLSSDGGILVGGSSSSFGLGGKDLLLLKLSPSGDLEWARVFGGRLDEEIFSLTSTPEGYLVGGYTSSSGKGNKDFFVLKLDPRGNLLWGKTFGGSGEDVARAMAFDPQMGMVISGYSSSFGSGDRDFLALKLDSSGEVPGVSCGFFSTWTPSTITPSISINSVTPTIMAPSWALSDCALNLSSPQVLSQVVCQSPPYYSLQVEVSPPGSGTVLRNPDFPRYMEGTQVTLTASPLEHFHFDSWSGDASGTSTVISLVMDSPKEITASFSPDLCTVTFDRNGGDTDPVPSFFEVPYGGFLESLPQPPTRAGHTFLGWNCSPDGSGDWFSINSPIFGDLTLFAQWEVNKYRLSISIEGKGEVLVPEDDSFEFGSQVSLTATPSPGYQFDQWKGDVPDGHERDNPLILKVDSDKTLTAVFREVDDPVPLPSLGWMGLILLSSALVLISLFFL
ncbi:MAG: InlB B-repeat-containing protein [Caldisericota bacterium]|nr:InlB B-repeat-containing protein [Caldisericota bacterium]